MGIALGLTFGVGLLLSLRGALTPPSRSRRPGSHRSVMSTVRSIARAALSAGTAAAVVLLLTGIPAAALLAGACGAAIPAVARQRSAVRARSAQRAAWPDALDDLLTAVRAGVPLPDGLCSAAESGPEPLRSGFAAYAAAWRRGASFVSSLAAMQLHFDNADADRVVVSLAMAAEAGGRNVGAVLATQSEFLRSDLRMRGEIEARQSWTVNAARVAVAAPWLAVAVLSVRGEAASAYATPAGAVVLLTAAAVGVVAYWVMTRIAALPQPLRLPQVAP